MPFGDVDRSTLIKSYEGGLYLEKIRFAKFTLLIEGIHKCIQKMKVDTVSELGIKSVHVSWLYTLLRHEEGLTAAELAQQSMVDRSLVSREIASLKRSGHVSVTGGSEGRGYNSRITLTDEGRALAERIADEVLNVQNTVDEGISEEELRSFYSTLDKLSKNFQNLTIPTGKRII